MEGNLVIYPGRCADPPLHCANMHLSPARHSSRYLMISELLTSAKMRINGVSHEGYYRLVILVHCALPLGDAHAAQKSIDSAGLASFTITCSRPPMHAIATVLSIVAAPVGYCAYIPGCL